MKSSTIIEETERRCFKGNVLRALYFKCQSKKNSSGTYQRAVDDGQLCHLFIISQLVFHVPGYGAQIEQ